MLLQIFAKAPVPGQVKTRLVPPLTPEESADLSRALVTRTLRVATEAQVAAIELWCSPDTNDPFFRDCVATYGVALRTQGQGDLGTRMRTALTDALALGQTPVLIGTDCAVMDAKYLRDAFRALDGHDAVFGPAEDGGYILVGLKLDLDCFKGVRWSTPHVMQDTRTRLQAARARWCELPELWDVDTPGDLIRLRTLPAWSELSPRE